GGGRRLCLQGHRRRISYALGDSLGTGGRKTSAAKSQKRNGGRNPHRPRSLSGAGGGTGSPFAGSQSPGGKQPAADFLPFGHPGVCLYGRGGKDGPAAGPPARHGDRAAS